jgi:hypothetical protein
MLLVHISLLCKGSLLTVIKESSFTGSPSQVASNWRRAIAPSSMVSLCGTCVSGSHKAGKKGKISCTCNELKE